MNQKVYLVELSDEHLTEPQFEPKDQLDLDSFGSLTEKEKKAISLRFFSDEDFDEIAKALSTPKVKYFRM